VSAPDVSVVIPTRNRRERLRLALRSALRQRAVDVEVVVVDDGSTDGTDELVEAVGDARIRWIRREVSGGVGAARNEGIAAAVGRWVAFLDDDDVWSPDKLALQVEALRSGDAAWAYGGDVVIDAELRVLGGAPPPEPDHVVRLLGRYNAVPAGASNVVVVADVLRRVGGFDPALRTSEDWDMWIRLAREGAPVCVRQPLVAVAVHEGNASRDAARMLEEIETIRGRYGIPVDRPRHLRWAAWTALNEGRRRDAVRSYLRAAAAGDVRSIVRAAAASAAPARMVRRSSRVRTDVSAAWIREATTWLEEVRAWEEASSIG
jgi:glycosyltransferase involved in cell wall biosynthesis